MIKKLLYLILLFVYSINGNSQFKGIVYHDINGNGKLDKKEKGVPNAVVSNGLQVIKTDSKGSFTLPEWEKARFVTLYPNAGQKVTKRFIPIKANQTSYNFGIKMVPKKSKVSFVQISDTETYIYKEWLNNLKAYVKNESPDFVVHTGDICYHSGIKWHSKEVTEKDLGIPVYYCLGNHDLTKGAFGEEYFEKHLGPAWYAIQRGNALYVITPMMGGDYKPGFTRKEIGSWMQNLLDTYPKDMPKYFFNHDLLSNTGEFKFKIDDQNSILLNDYNLKAWVFGHWHINMTKTHRNTSIKSYSTASASQGGIDSSPSSFRVVTVDEEGNSTSKLIWTYVDKSLQVISPSNKTVFFNHKGKIPISINIYSSETSVDSVKYALYDADKRHWDTAKLESEMMSMTQCSDWNWETSAAPIQNVKNYKLTVYAYLKDGQVLFQQKTFSLQERLSKNDLEGTIWNNLAGNPEHDAALKIDHNDTYTLEWVKNTGENIYMSSPLIKDNKVFTGTFDDGNAEKNHILCFDARTGQELWRYQTRNGIKNQMVIANNLVIGTDMQGYTYALDADSGKPIWKKDLEYDRLSGFVSGIVTDEQAVYTGFGHSLEALDTRTGKTLWKNKDWSGGEGTTTTMTLADDILITSSNWRALYAHDKKTGKLIWKRADDGLRFRNGNVLYKEGNLWIAENSNNKGTLHRLDPKTGKTLEKMDTQMQNKATSTPILTSDYFFIAGSDPGIAAFNRKSGKKQWEFSVQPAIFYTPQYYSDSQKSIQSTPILINDSLLFGAMDGYIYNLDAKSGYVLWKTYVGTPVMTSAAITQNGFFICDFAGNIYKYTNK